MVIEKPLVKVAQRKVVSFPRRLNSGGIKIDLGASAYQVILKFITKLTCSYPRTVVQKPYL
jgi:hypothetical protein